MMAVIIVMVTKNKEAYMFIARERERRLKLEPWCCYIGSQPQSLQICFKSKPINKIKSGQDKI